MAMFTKKHKTLLTAFLALAGALCFSYVLPDNDVAAWNVAYCALFAAAAFYLVWRALRVMTMPMAFFAVAGGALLSLSLTVGAEVARGMTVSLTIGGLLLKAVLTLGMTPAIAAAIVFLLDGLPRWTEKLTRGKLETSRLNPAKWPGRRVFFLAWGVLILCWLPCYLGYFPGVWGYDMHNQNHQALTGLYNAYQPLLHTLLYQLCYRVGMGVFGTGTAGVAVFSAAQSLILSACLAYVIFWLIKKLRIPFALTILSLGFFALMPFHAILAVSSTKDTVFAGLFLLALTQTVDLCVDTAGFLGNWKRIVAYVLSVLLICLLRNNMLYAFVFGTVFLVLGLKAQRTRVLLLAVVCVAVAVVGGKGLKSALSAGDGPRTELLNVPIQQVATVYDRHQGELTDEEKTAIYAYLPEELLVNYNPLLSDPVKLDAPIGDGLPSIMGFLKVWARFLPSYFNDYVDSFLTMTLGYWYPGETFHAHVYDGYYQPDGDPIEALEVEESLGYMYTGFIENINPEVEQRSLWQGAANYYQWFAHENGHQRIPFIALLFAPGTYCCFLFIVLLALLYFKQYRLALPLALPYGVWLTLLLGPCTIIRYAYPIMAATPILAGLLFNRLPGYAMEAPKTQAHGSDNGRLWEMLRFAVAGGVGFVIDYGLTYVFTAFVGVHYLLATGLAFAISVVANYFMCAYWVFQGADVKNVGVKAGFLATSLIGLGLNELFMYLLVDLAHVPVMLSKLIAVVLVMIWNYISKRKVLVKQPKN